MRYAVAVLCCLAVHVAAALWLRPWSDVVLAAGGLFVHNTDIASLPGRLFSGLLLTAPVPVIGAILLARTFGPQRQASTSLVNYDETDGADKS